MCQSSNFCWKQGKPSCGSGHKMITWSYFSRDSLLIVIFFFFNAFHQAAGRAEAGLLAPRAPCHRLSLKGNTPSSFSPPSTSPPSDSCRHPGGRLQHTLTPTDRQTCCSLFFPSFWIRTAGGRFSGLSDLVVASWSRFASLSSFSRCRFQRTYATTLMVFHLSSSFKRCLLLHFSYTEKGTITRPPCPESAVYSVFFFSLSPSGHGGEWEHKNVSVYAQNCMTLLLFPSCLPQPVISTDSPHDIFCHRILLSAWCACLTPPSKPLNK